MRPTNTDFKNYETIQEDEGEITLIISGFLDVDDVIPDMSAVAKAKSSGNYKEEEDDDTKTGIDVELAHSRFKAIIKHYKKLSVLRETKDNNDKAVLKCQDALAEVFSSLKLIPAQMEPLLEFVRYDMQQIRDPSKDKSQESSYLGIQAFSQNEKLGKY